MRRVEEINHIFPQEMRVWWKGLSQEMEDVQEIRLRVGKPVLLKIRNVEYWLKEQGGITKEVGEAKIILAKELQGILNHVCNYSLYAYEEELRRGYLTLAGGHRLGITGEVIEKEGKIRNFKYITGLNIRISHQIIGCADVVMPFLYMEGNFYNTMIVSPPGCGKTTLLRDIIRQVSDGNRHGRGINTSVIDERSEIAGCFAGISQNDVGMRTDILDGCPKAAGMMMAVRSLAPDLIAVDELGSRSDLQALEQVAQCGCAFVATVHGESLEGICKKKNFAYLWDNKVFQRYIILKKEEKVGQVGGIYDAEFQPCIKGDCDNFCHTRK